MPVSYSKYFDKGPWSVVTTDPSEWHETFIVSQNFEHDVRLHVTGDFATIGDRELYAQAIAEVLNAATDKA